MNKQKPTRQVNDYVLLFSAGAALSVVFLWIASYIFPEGEIIGGRRVFENIPKSIQYIFYILCITKANTQCVVSLTLKSN